LRISGQNSAAFHHGTPQWRGEKWLGSLFILFANNKPFNK